MYSLPFFNLLMEMKILINKKASLKEKEELLRNMAHKIYIKYFIFISFIISIIFIYIFEERELFFYFYE